MFDLFSFWASTTVTTFMLLFPVVVLAGWLVQKMLSEVLEDKLSAKELLSKLWYIRGDTLYLGVKSLDKDTYGTPDPVRPLFWLETWFLVPMCLGFPLIVLLAIGMSADNSTEVLSFLEHMARINVFFAPLFGSLLIVAIVYFGIVFVGRRVVRKSREITSLLNKVKDYEPKDKGEG